MLHLDPCTNPDEPAIQCRRQVVSLDDKPEYEALSYAWGDASAVHSILLDGASFVIPHSAWSALYALRSCDQVRTLWIDAICIRQDDLAKRAAQLKLMGLIYRQAYSVRVWLGADDDADKDAMAILRTMTSRDGASETLGYGNEAQARMAKLRGFFARPWWQRLWVVQELSLARHVVVQQGTKEMPFDDLVAAYHTSNAYFGENLRGYTRGMFSREGEKLMDIFESVRVLDHTRELCAVELGSTQDGD